MFDRLGKVGRTAMLKIPPENNKIWKISVFRVVIWIFERVQNDHRVSLVLSPTKFILRDTWIAIGEGKWRYKKIVSFTLRDTCITIWELLMKQKHFFCLIGNNSIFQYLHNLENQHLQACPSLGANCRSGQMAHIVPSYLSHFLQPRCRDSDIHKQGIRGWKARSVMEQI